MGNSLNSCFATDDSDPQYPRAYGDQSPRSYDSPRSTPRPGLVSDSPRSQPHPWASQDNRIICAPRIIKADSSGAGGEQPLSADAQQFGLHIPGACEWDGPEDAPRVASGIPRHNDPSAPPDGTTSWTPVDAARFRLRHGDDYPTTGAKEPSEAAMYDCLGMDVWRSKKPIYHIGSQLQVPIVDRNNPSAYVPTILLLNVMVPTSSPSMFKKSTNGETVNVVFCFVMRSWTADALHRLDDPTTPPSVRLLDQYFDRKHKISQNEPERFKIVGSVTNWDDAKLPNMLAGFNGKPTLVTKSGMWYSTCREGGGGYAELDCNTAHWCYVARQGLHAAWSSVGRCVFDFGVTIEAREDENMPERLLGAVTCNHVLLDSADIPRWEHARPKQPKKEPLTKWACAPPNKK